ncbi:MAG: hypothetical protein AAFZ52_15380, partial [Bacteroidota bacterium]
MAYQDPKPSRQRRQKRRDKRLTDNVSSERDRTSDYKSYKCRRRQVALTDQLPARERMTAHLLNERRTYTERTRPLRNYLASRVGQPWDAVYADLRRRVGNTFLGNQALHHYVWQYVEWRVKCGTDGRWYFDFPYDYYRERPLRPGSLFVDPDTGLLRRNVASTRKRQQNQDPNHVKHSVIQVPGHYLEADRCYDLRLTYRQREQAELRVRLLERPRQTIHHHTALSFVLRKGQRP